MKKKIVIAKAGGQAREAIVVSLGGSLVAPDSIDIEFLKKFKQSLQKFLNSKGFIIFVGGGKIARVYQRALAEFGAKDKGKDLIGIAVSRLNAEVVKNIFGKTAHKEMIANPSKNQFGSKKIRNKIIFGSGWKPGWSTDYVSVLSAKANGIKTIINLTNVDYVYDKNPKEFSDAKPIEKISWKDFRKIVGNKWIPGLSMPFDPRASRIAQKLKIKVAIINGKNLERLEDFLNNKPFIGTVIQ
jgi:uridylate kinase